MPFSANDGQRSNIKMSDMIISLTDNGGGSGLNTSTSTSTVSYGTGFNLSYMYGKTQYNDSNGDGSDSGYWSYYNNNAISATSTPLTSVGRFTHQYGRYRSGTGSPSNSSVQTSGQINMSNLTGMSLSALTTDPCGETRGVKAGYTTSTGTKVIYARYQTGANSGSNKNWKPGIIVSGSKAGPGVDTIQSDIVDLATHIGYSAYTTYHTNQWTHLGLNTKLCTGDRVIVVAHGGGGTMYTFSNTDPIYLRTSGNSAVSATVSTLGSPHKNETGTDDWIAIYSAVANADGATRVLVNPFHSSAQPYIFHVFCIKGPNTTATINGVNYTTKYTTYETSITHTSAPATTGGFTTKQRYFIGLSTSPFTSNGSYAGNLGAIAYNQGVDAHYWTSGGSGSGFVTICNYTGGTRGSQSTDKYGFTYTNALTGFYTPQYGRMIPIQDGRFIEISGTRG